MTSLILWRTILLCLAGACGVGGVFLRAAKPARNVCFTAAAAFLMLFAVASMPVNTEPAVEPAPTYRGKSPRRPRHRPAVQCASLPSASTDQGYVSSQSCRECHPDQHASWRRTYHRTMTQAASPESVIPEWDNVTLTSRGREYRLLRRGDEFWVNMIPPSVEMKAFINKIDLSGRTDVPRKTMQVVMTTGSHLHQTYWVQAPSGTFIQFPWVYHIKQGRWVFRIDSFLAPPHDTLLFNYWNISCIGCHATGGNPRVSERTRTMHSSGEMGIACEACHGPGAWHVHNQELAAFGETSVPNPPIDFDVVNPDGLSPEKSAQVCGQCHSIAEKIDESRWRREGDPYRPGQDNFFANRRLATTKDDLNKPIETVGGMRESTRFWPDGAVRAGGREYNGLVDSPCYVNGHGENKLTCTSCHSMHDAHPNKQVASGMETNRGCTQCHQEPRFNKNLESHTHHPVGSSGSRCYNCHMPRTSYALFHAARSHRIDSPRAAKTTGGERPNACNLCHLDQTMQWTADHLSQWYDVAPPQLSDDDEEIAASVLWALRGDASQRSLAAWHFGWRPALKASGDDWPARYLAELLVDPYGAVRYLAHESLQSLSGYENLDFAFNGTEEERAATRQHVLDTWAEAAADSADSRESRLLIGAEDAAKIEALMNQRDNRPITVLE